MQIFLICHKILLFFYYFYFSLLPPLYNCSNLMEFAFAETMISLTTKPIVSLYSVHTFILLLFGLLYCFFGSCRSNWVLYYNALRICIRFVQERLIKDFYTYLCRIFYFERFNRFSAITKTIYRKRRNSSIEKEKNTCIKYRNICMLMLNTTFGLVVLE